MVFYILIQGRRASLRSALAPGSHISRRRRWASNRCLLMVPFTHGPFTRGPFTRGAGYSWGPVTRGAGYSWGRLLVGPVTRGAGYSRGRLLARESFDLVGKGGDGEGRGGFVAGGDFDCLRAKQGARLFRDGFLVEQNDMLAGR